MEILAIGIFGIMAISISELWQSNKRLKKMLELDKVKARLFDENRALEDKAFNVMEQFTNE